ncbi:flagellar biosynthesis anti-sigma factor FlgM [Tunturiibacter gelidoferens]|uniref:Negative regulator of flagellin synthesis FlgM n=1 Tax=Tunturiibacter gelidiferens TaxID=3069689 RepID=A0ACC5NVG5_9BACT|nr:flagellar biosynthesis anti-sigma factor FlgM [Edaphobacter lichenicola]MBB5338505.1 negative regulator of flagellin synthesis FlgM [Edaphobacter lichenicola]
MSYISGIGSQQTANAVTLSEAQPVVTVNAPGTVGDKSEALSANVGRADDTALSSTGGLVLQSLGASDTRTAKVSSLQEAIAAGRYTVSSSDVADKIMRSLLE